jgi:hypothetical protein
MSPGACGMGAHCHWLPWVSANHMHGMLQEYYDPSVFGPLAN